MTIALSQTQSLKEMLALEEKRAALQGLGLGEGYCHGRTVRELLDGCKH